MDSDTGERAVRTGGWMAVGGAAALVTGSTRSASRSSRGSRARLRGGPPPATRAPEVDAGLTISAIALAIAAAIALRELAKRG
jgi:hypothetical protein